MNNPASYECPALNCTFKVLTEGGMPVPHKCPYYGGITKVSWKMHGPSILQQMWAHGDYLMNAYQNSEPHDVEFYKCQMLGLAFALKLFMMPHLTTESEIAQELLRRYEAKQRGDEQYETAGLGSRVYEAPPNDNKYETRANPQAAEKAAARVQAKVQEIPERRRQQIRTFSQQMSEAETCEMFSIDADVLKAIVSG